MDLISLLIGIILVGLICYVLWWLIEKIGLPEPFNKIAVVLVALIAVVYLLGVLGGMVPVFQFRR